MHPQLLVLPAPEAFVVVAFTLEELLEVGLAVELPVEGSVAAQAGEGGRAGLAGHGDSAAAWGNWGGLGDTGTAEGGTCRRGPLGPTAPSHQQRLWGLLWGELGGSPGAQPRLCVLYREALA